MKLISHIIKKEVEKLKRKNFLTENRFNYLRLDNNDLSGAIPTSMGDLGQLRMLYLLNNELTGTIPENFCNLYNNPDGFMLMLNNNFHQIMGLQ
mgnify:CR=1 FL=1